MTTLVEHSLAESTESTYTFAQKIDLTCGDLHIMAIRVVEFSNGGYKIRKVFA